MPELRELVVFGDSLSDTGNFGPANPLLTGILNSMGHTDKPFYRPQSKCCRFGDGWVWLDYVRLFIMNNGNLETSKPESPIHNDPIKSYFNNPQGKDKLYSVPMHLHGVINYAIGGTMISKHKHSALGYGRTEQMTLPQLERQIRQFEKHQNAYLKASFRSSALLSAPPASPNYSSSSLPSPSSSSSPSTSSSSSPSSSSSSSPSPSSSSSPNYSSSSPSSSIGYSPISTLGTSISTDEVKVAIVWLGANDLITAFGDKFKLTSHGLANPDTIISTFDFIKQKLLALCDHIFEALISKGFKSIILINMPPFEITPEFTLAAGANASAQSEGARNIASMFNGLMNGIEPTYADLKPTQFKIWKDKYNFDGFKDHFSYNGIYIVDVYRLLLRGLTEINSKENLLLMRLTGGNPINQVLNRFNNSMACSPISINEQFRFLNAGIITDSPNSTTPYFGFFDSLHPSSLVHKAIGFVVYSILSGSGLGFTQIKRVLQGCSSDVVLIPYNSNYLFIENQIWYNPKLVDFWS